MKILSKYNIDEALEYLEKELMRREHQTESEIFWENSKGEKIDITVMNIVHLKNVIDKLQRVRLVIEEYYSGL